MRIYNFSIFAPQTKYKSLKEIARCITKLAQYKLFW